MSHASTSPIRSTPRSATSEHLSGKRRAVRIAVLAGAVTDREERALHLARAAEGPDASIAVELDVAAESAAGRGAARSWR